MRVVALLAVRNEAHCLANCLRYLADEGVETCVLDNDSTDGSLDIAKEHLGKGVFRIERLPYLDRFDLSAQLRMKELLAEDISADWFIHHDADEIRESNGRAGGLVEALSAAERNGYNAVQFDEFVFLPTAEDVTAGLDYRGSAYYREMRHYYYYLPDSPARWRVNAWRKTPDVDLVSSAGHHVNFPGIRVAPERLALRHYMVFGVAHAVSKYERTFPASEIEKGWHYDQITFDKSKLRFPPASSLELARPGELLCKLDPWRHHPIF